jgi:hypothetical protein
MVKIENPFGRHGDRFEDVFLVRLWREEVRPDKDLDNICEEFFGNCKTVEDYQKAREKLKQKYGEEEASQIAFYYQASNMWGHGSLCSDCIIRHLGVDYFQGVMKYLENRDEIQFDFL